MLPQVLTSPYQMVSLTQVADFERFLDGHYLSIAKLYKTGLPDIYESESESIVFYYVDLALNERKLTFADLSHEEYHAMAAEAVGSQDLQRFAEDIFRYYTNNRFTHAKHLFPRGGFSCVMR